MGDGDKYLDLTHPHANNGQWHVLRMSRHGHEFHLYLDGGEGKNYNYTLRSPGDKERDVFILDRRVYSGAYKQGIGLSSVLTDDLINSKFVWFLLFGDPKVSTERESKSITVIVNWLLFVSFGCLFSVLHFHRQVKGQK